MTFVEKKEWFRAAKGFARVLNLPGHQVRESAPAVFQGSEISMQNGF